MSKEREFLKKLRYASLLENDLRKELEELLAQPEQEPLSDYILSKEIDIIKKDNDFSNVRPWQIYYLARRIEELHGIGGEK